jgi:hypothetical protein
LRSGKPAKWKTLHRLFAKTPGKMEGIDPWSTDFTMHSDIACWLLDVGHTNDADVCLWIEYAFNYREIFV